MKKYFVTSIPPFEVYCFSPEFSAAHFKNESSKEIVLFPIAKFDMPGDAEEYCLFKNSKEKNQ